MTETVWYVHLRVTPQMEDQAKMFPEMKFNEADVSFKKKSGSGRVSDVNVKVLNTTVEAYLMVNTRKAAALTWAN